MSWARRGLAALLLVSVFPGTAPAATRSVILVVGDGMGTGHLRAASIALRGADGKLAMQGLPSGGRATTHSADEAVTDIAAAATALATGRKTNNGVLSISAGGTRLKTILEACREAGKATGLVSDSRITSPATACFAVHAEDAGIEYDLAGQLVAAKVTVMLGGGRANFTAPKVEAWVGVNVLDDGGRKLLSITDTVDWHEYRILKHAFLAPPGARKASVWAWRQPGPFNLYLDDIRLEPADENGNPTGSGLLLDPGFDGGEMAGWSNWGNLTVVSDTGSKALMVAGQGGGEQTAEIKPGTNYGVGYRVRLDDPLAGGTVPSPWESAVTQGYRRVVSKEELAGVKGGLVLGLFGEGDLAATGAEPTLAGMTGGALDLLGENRDGFILVVNGNRIDRACRAKDEKDLVRQVWAFDEAVAAAVEFAKRDGDVLVVVTSGYETGGVKVTGNNAKDLNVKFGGSGPTAAPVPVFASGPGSEAFTGEMDNTEIARKIAAAMGVRL